MRLIWPTVLREKRATCEILAYTGYSPRREQQNSLMRMSVLLWCSMFQTKEIFLLKQFFLTHPSETNNWQRKIPILLS
jgi:hypothetical protein